MGYNTNQTALSPKSSQTCCCLGSKNCTGKGEKISEFEHRVLFTEIEIGEIDRDIENGPEICSLL